MLRHTNRNSIWMGDPFSVHPTTYGPPNHSGNIQVNWIPPINHVGTQGLTLTEIGASQLVHSHSRCSSLKEGNSFWAPFNSCYACLGVTTHRLRRTRK
jgi:hypothetical protein